MTTKTNEYIRYYLDNFSSGKVDKWNYEDACVLIGAIQIYEATGDIYYRDFVVNYFDKYITEDGKINFYDKENYNIDCICPGRPLFFAYEETKDEKYKKAMDVLYNQLEDHPRTESNNFWHKKIYPNQIWLDGLFMAQPFYMLYETKIGKKEHYSDIINQFKNVRKFLFNEDSGLYYHGYDEARIQPWADKETGLSKNYWLRAMGWYVLGLIDTMEAMDEMVFEYYKDLEALFKEAIKGLLQYQDKKSKLFYQLIDKKDVEGNYLETSGSVMIAAAILKACRMRVLLPEKYQPIGEEIFGAVVNQKLVKEDGIPMLKDICSMAGLGPNDTRDGSVEYYLSEPIVADDHKGTGAFMMAYGQLLLLKKKQGEKIENGI